jgi:hypothetical protein
LPFPVFQGLLQITIPVSNVETQPASLRVDCAIACFYRGLLRNPPQRRARTSAGRLTTRDDRLILQQPLHRRYCQLKITSYTVPFPMLFPTPGLAG